MDVSGVDTERRIRAQFFCYSLHTHLSTSSQKRLGNVAFCKELELHKNAYRMKIQPNDDEGCSDKDDKLPNEESGQNTEDNDQVSEENNKALK